MNPDKPNLPTFFNGTYAHGIDEKRRVQVPAKWRPTDTSNFEFTVIVWPKYAEGICLRVLPPKEMVKLVESLDALSNSDPAKPTLKRLIGSNSTQVELDKAGRICIPESMAQAAGLAKDAVLVGMLDKFEIWSPERRAMRKIADEALGAEMFKGIE